ncbi:MAG: TetR/AcrR family transcriptional regulator [Chloroflexi bacterium]|nr:TetR/AcrR family transcriptional regulator [Chloroflexota bacterium]
MASKRDHIIETACELFELQGYNATGLNEIVRKSGSPKGSLYHYFPGGKDELTAEAITHTGEAIRRRIELSLSAVDAPADAVRQFIRDLSVHVEASGYRAGGPITTIALETAATNDVLREECAAVYGVWQAAFAQKLAAGGITPDRAARLATLIVAVLEGAILLSRTERSRQPLLDAAEELGVLIACAL